MKKTVFLSIFLMGCLISSYSQVAISKGDHDPHPAAVLDLIADDKGFLVPKVELNGTDDVSTIDINATHDHDAVGMLVYNTNTTNTGSNDVSPGFYYWNGSEWISLTTAPGGVDGWGLTGNSGIIDGTHFLGTTNDAALNFRVNNQRAGRISPSSDEGDVFLGYQAGNNNTGVHNTAVGYEALYENTSGDNNTALGYNAAYNNTTGSENVAIGSSALFSNTTLSNNIAIGESALFSLSASDDNDGGNIAIGYNTLYHTDATSETNARYNVALGYRAMENNTTGQYKIAIGYNALAAMEGGLSSIAIGRNAMEEATGTVSNIGIGQNALRITAGLSNVAIGTHSLRSHETGNHNVALGVASLQYSETGEKNTAVGYWALGNSITGSNNTAIGENASPWNQTGSENVVIGSQAGRHVAAGGNHTSFSNSIFIGYEVRGSAQGVSNEIVIGHEAIGRGSNTVRIGNDDTENNYFTGSVFADATLLTSDKNLKTNITNLENSLEIVSKLQGVRFDWKKEENITEGQGSKIGFIAQDVEKVVPELVATDSDGKKSLSYSEINAILVEAIKELEQNQKELLQRIEELENK